LELTVGPSSKKKPTVTKGVTAMATRYAFTIMGRTHGQQTTDRGYPLTAQKI
jgi:hypothetical protein